MQNATNIREHMEVVGSDGSHVGVVDRLDGMTIRLTRSDPNAGGVHHWIPMQWVARVDSVVHLNKNLADATHQWQSAAPAAPKL